MPINNRINFIIGAQKSATTFLSDILALHPEICLSTPKEPDYFTVHRDKPIAQYERAFGAPHRKVLLDASTSYSSAPSLPEERQVDNPRFGVPERIWRFAGPSARFIYVLRPPVERVWSSYWHERRAGHESAPFREAVERRSWYLDLSRYDFQIGQYLEFYPAEALLVLTQQEVTGRSRETAERCWAHFGLEPVPIEFSQEKRNSSYSYNKAGLFFRKTFGGTAGLKAATGIARAILPSRLINAARAALTRPIPAMPEFERRRIYAMLEEDIKRLRDRTGMDFTIAP